MRPRSLARRLALQYLYMVDLIPADRAQPLDVFLADYADDADVREFAAGLARAVLDARDEIDRDLGANARNWELARVAVVERNVLRLAVAEARVGETPLAVVVSEAVNLAKRFGGKGSGPFVHGVLDATLKRAAETTDGVSHDPLG